MPDIYSPFIVVQTPNGPADAATGQLLNPMPNGVSYQEALPAYQPPTAQPIVQQQIPQAVEAGLQNQAAVPQQTQGPSISRQSLIALAEDAGVRSLSGAGQREWLRQQAEALARSAPEPVSVDQMERALRAQYVGQGYQFDDDGGSLLQTNPVSQVVRNAPSIVLGGVGGLAETLGGLTSIADSAIGTIPGFEATDSFWTSPVRTGLQFAADAFSTTGRNLRDFGQAIESDTVQEARQRVNELVEANRLGDLFTYITTTAPGIALASSTIGESVIPFGILARARTALAGVNAARTGMTASEIGALSGLIGAGTAASRLAEDGQLTPAEATGALVVGGTTGGLTGLASRFAPVPEAVVARLAAGIPAQATTTAGALRSFLSGVTRGSVAEGTSEGAQEWVESVITSGYDSSGRWNPDLIDWTGAQGAAVTGAGIGLLGGAASGGFESRASTRAAQANVAPVDLLPMEAAPTDSALPALGTLTNGTQQTAVAAGQQTQQTQGAVQYPLDLPLYSPRASQQLPLDLPLFDPLGESNNVINLLSTNLGRDLVTDLRNRVQEAGDETSQRAVLAPAVANIQQRLTAAINEDPGNAELYQQDLVTVQNIVSSFAPSATATNAVQGNVPSAAQPVSDVTAQGLPAYSPPVAQNPVSAPAVDNGNMIAVELQPIEDLTQTIADIPGTIPPAALFEESAWQTQLGRSRAEMARNSYQVDPNYAQPRRLLIDALNDIAKLGTKPDGSLVSESTRSFADAQRANNILEAMRKAEEISPVPEELRVDYRENSDVPAGKLPAGDDPTLMHHVDFGAFLERGDITGALNWARDNLNSSTNRLLTPLAQWASEATTPLRVQLTDAPGVVNGNTVEAWFSPQQGTIFITKRSAGTPYYLLHETVHALTENAIQNPSVLNTQQAQALSTLQDLYQEAVDQRLLPESALPNLSEFVAEVWSNPNVQHRMFYRSQVPGVSRLQSAYKAFVNLIRRVLGMAPDAQTALESVAVASYALSSASQRSDTAQVTYDAAHAYRRDASGKKIIEAVIYSNPDNTATIRNIKTGDTIITTSLPEAAAALQKVPGIRVSEISLSTTQDTKAAESIYNQQALTPLARAARGAVERIVGRIAPERASVLADSLVGSMRMIKSKSVNRMALLQELQRLTGVPIFDDYMVEQSRQRARYSREVGDIASMMNDTGRALAEVNTTVERFGDYLYALHVNERNQQRGKNGKDTTAFSFNYNGQRYANTTGTAAEATRLVQQFNQSLTSDERRVFSAMAAKWRVIQKDILDAEYELGLYDESTYLSLGGTRADGTQIDSAYRYYVPLLNESRSGRAIPGTGIVGRDTTASNPYESLYRQLVQRTNRLAQFGARKNLLRLLESHPLPDLATIDSARVTWDDDGNPIAVNDRENIRNNSIYVPDEGGWRRILVKSDTSQGRALLEAFNKNPYDAATNRVLGGLSTITRTLAAANTTFSIPFALKSLVWDATTTLFNFQGSFDRSIPILKAYELSLRSFRHAASALASEGLGLAAGRGSAIDPMITLYNSLGGGVNVGAVADGGQLAAALRSQTALNTKQIYQSPLLAGRAVAGRALKTLGETLHSPSQALRYGAFKSYLEHRAGRTFGANDQDALLTWLSTPQGQDSLRKAVVGSKEISGNFELRGTGTWMPSLFAFWNAAMQGTRLFASMATSAQGLSGLAALFILGFFSALDAASDPDDEDEDGGSRYARSTDRLQNLLVDSNSGFQLPVAYELRVPFVFGSSLALALTDRLSYSKLFTNTMTAALDMVTPLSAPGNIDAPFNIAYALSPTAVQVAAYPLAFGKDAFGRDIDPMYLTDATGNRISNPSWAEQSSFRSYKTLDELTQWLWQTSDGTIDLSPTRLSALADNVLGSAGRFAKQALSTPNPDIGYTDIPAIQQITRTFRYRDNPFALQEEFSEIQQNVATSLRFVKQRASDGGDGIDLLNATTALNEVTAIEREIQNIPRTVKVRGFSASELRAARDAAKQQNDETAQIQAENDLRAYYQQRDVMLGQALTKLKAIEDRLKNE